jgi:hypothetical protein
MNPMDLKRGIDKAVTALVEELKKKPRKPPPRQRNRTSRFDLCEQRRNHWQDHC